MKYFQKFIFLYLILIVSLLASANTKKPESVSLSYKAYVLKHKWHTGIILKISDINDHMILLCNDFSSSNYIEIGWGDKGFYMAEKETVWLALKAVLWPTKSVLHVAEITNQQLIQFNENELIELQLNEKDFNTLILHINQSFYINENEELESLGNGLYGNSQFYLSTEKYHLFKTCNVWLARGLKKSNVPIKPFYALTSKNVMKQLKNVDTFDNKLTD